MRIKVPRPKLPYRNPHAQLHTFTVPTPKQSDTPVFPSNLRRSRRDLRTSTFLTHQQVNSFLPCQSPRVKTQNKFNPSLNLEGRLLNSVTHPTIGAQCEFHRLAAGKVPGQYSIVWNRAFF